MSTEKTKILLVEDDRNLGNLLKDYLLAKGFDTTLEVDGDKGLKAFSAATYDMCVLDIMMPIKDGFTLAKEIRNTNKNIPIIFLTARSLKEDKLEGFRSGGDDYITKPIKPKVLVSKVKALLRRFKEGAVTAEAEDITSVGDLIINREEYKIVHKGIEMVLPRKEFELLALLASKPNKVFKREVILDKVWGNEVVVGGRTIDVHIRKLREKIGNNNFKTVKGVGYKFVF